SSASLFLSRLVFTTPLRLSTSILTPCHTVVRSLISIPISLPPFLSFCHIDQSGVYTTRQKVLRLSAVPVRKKLTILTTLE
ncbi:MAG: hypothetical protein J3Q66DRAFT_300675, partial [Benniella sp.]